MFSCCNYEFIVYDAFSHVYFWRQKFSLQTHIVSQNRRQKSAPEIGVDLWCRFMGIIIITFSPALVTFKERLKMHVLHRSYPGITF